MKCQNINFSPITFTSPGIYSYTIKELTPSDANWKTDSRIYRVVVTVTDNGHGALEARVEYPDGFPRFVNKRKCKCCKCCPPPPPFDPCKFFKCIPFPMFWFAPPQKPEFEKIMKSTPHVLTFWDDLSKYWDSYRNRYWWDCLQKRWRSDPGGHKGVCFCTKRCQAKQERVHINGLHGFSRRFFANRGGRFRANPEVRAGSANEEW